MENQVGKICPVCNNAIAETDSVKVCSVCGVAYHESCWEANHGCVNGCSAQQAAPVAPAAPAATCVNCGAPMSADQGFCPRCGTAKPVAPRCTNCGIDLAPGQEFCPVCGLRVAPAAAPVGGQYTPYQPEPESKKKLIIAIAAGAVALIVAAIMLFGGSSGPDFKDLYDKYCNYIWADVGSDGSYLKLDTNPYDEDDNGVAYYDAYTAVKNVNNAIGLPESLLTAMGETSGADGRQSETFEEQGVTVTWKYHPDTGLEVTYKLID